MISEEKIIEWYHAYGQEILSYLMRFLGNQADAEDILHDCFANLIEYSLKHELREETIKPFLYRSAHNRAINHIKMKKNQEESASDISEADSVTSTPQEIYERAELERMIDAAISQLDPVTQSIFIMKKELSMANSEIAQNLTVSEKTIRRKLEKAMHFIVQELKKKGFEI